jgi:CheY-like chemotaxis protein
MIMDDAAEIRALLHDLLTDEGYDVRAYATLQDLSEVERVNPDLTILDLLFWGETQGWQTLQTLQQLQERPSTASIPVMLCSAADAQLEAHADAFRAKGVGMVAKPFSVDELLADINQALRPRPG